MDRRGNVHLELLDLNVMNILEVANHLIHSFQTLAVSVRARAVVAVGEVRSTYRPPPMFDINIVAATHVVDNGTFVGPMA